MKNKLITALRMAATALENDTFAYAWNYPERCNCAVVVCALLGLTPHELSTKLCQWFPQPSDPRRHHYTWSDKVGIFCPITGVPTHELFKQLSAFGLTPEDMVELEYLDNPKVLERLEAKTEPPGFFARLFRKKPSGPSFDNPDDVADYLREWADMLTEEGVGEAIAEADAILAQDQR